MMGANAFGWPYLAQAYAATRAVSATVGVPAESLSARNTTGALNIENLHAVTPSTQALSLEALRAITATGVARLEVTKGIAQTAAEPIETALGLHATNVLLSEWVKALTTTNQIPLESQLAVTPVSATAVFVIEGLHAIAQHTATNLEATRGLAVTAIDLLEAIRPIASSKTIPAELVAALKRSVVFPVDVAGEPALIQGIVVLQLLAVAAASIETRSGASVSLAIEQP
jgi:hypothetical protein